MKKFFKWFFIGFGVLVALIIILAVATSGNDQKTQKATHQTEQKAKTTSSEPQNGANLDDNQKDDETLTGFDKIEIGDSLSGKGGMTYDQVQAIVKKKPSDHTSSEIAAGDMTIKTDMYTWVTGLGKGFSVTFTNGHASAKVKVGE